MSILLKAASGNAVVTNGGWTNPTNAQSLTPAGTYATASPATGTDVTSDFSFPALTDTEIPVGSTINSVKIGLDAGMLTGSGADFVGVTPRNNNVDDSGGEQQIFGTQRYGLAYATTPSITDLKTAGRLTARIKAHNATGTMTGEIDDVFLIIDYTAPTTNGWSVKFASVIGPNGPGGTQTHTGRTITIPSLAVGDFVLVTIQRAASSNNMSSDTISDSVGNNYTTNRFNSFWTATSDGGMASAWTVATTGGTNVVVTSAYAGGVAQNYDSLKVVVVSNSLGTISIDGSATTATTPPTSSGSGADTITVGTVTPSQANDFIIADFTIRSGVGQVGTSPNQFLMDLMTNGTFDVPGGDSFTEHFVYSGTSAVSATGSMGAASQPYMAVVVALKYTVSGPFTVVQKAAGQNTGSATSLAQAFTSNVTAGNTIVVGIGLSGSTVSTVTDTNNNAYVLAKNNTGNTLYTYYATNVVGGATTVTVTYAAAATNRSITLTEYLTSTPALLDQTAVTSGGTAGSTTITSPSVTPVQNGELIYALGTDATRTVTWTAGSGYTLEQTSSSTTGLIAQEDQVQTTAAAITASLGGVTSGDTYSIIIATFRLAGTVLRPNSDITVGDWVPTPSSPTTLFDKLDEATATDTDLITGTTTVEVKLA